MNKEYIINRMCKINQENPTPHLDREIAINIEPVEKNNEFENYCLAIEGGRQWCEDYDAVCLKEEVLNNEVFVEKIIPDYIISNEEEKFYDKKGLYPPGNHYAVKIITKEYGDIIAYVYNEHNGYYSHSIYYSNDELKVDVMEESWL